MHLIKIMKLEDSIDKRRLFGYLLILGECRHFAMSKSVPHHMEGGHLEGVQTTKAGYQHHYGVAIVTIISTDDEMYLLFAHL